MAPLVTATALFAGCGADEAVTELGMQSSALKVKDTLSPGNVAVSDQGVFYEPDPGWSGCDVCTLIMEPGGTENGLPVGRLRIEHDPELGQWTIARLTLNTEAGSVSRLVSRTQDAAARGQTFEESGLAIPPGQELEAKLELINGNAEKPKRYVEVEESR